MMRGLNRRFSAFVLALVFSLGLVPVVSAHGGLVYVNGIRLAQWYGLIPLVLGIGLVLGSRYFPRFYPAYAQYALYGIFAGLIIAVFGAIWIVQLSPVEWYTEDPIIPRALHAELMFLIGCIIMLGSVIGGQLRWPRRPRYAGFGVLLGCWVAYPGLSTVGLHPVTNPLGYFIVFLLPTALCYVLWRDARNVLDQLSTDRVARRFGIAVGLLAVVFFMFSTGMIYLIPDDGVGVSLSQRIIAIMPAEDPLVIWPTFEFWLPEVPLGGAISVGTALLIAIFGGLIGLNGALFAFQWNRSTSAGASQTTAGIAGIAAPQACCCCGPALSQLAVVTLGPSAAAPIYLLFADPSSSIGSLFFVASVAILTGTLVRAAQKTPHSGSEQSTVPANLSS